MRRPKIVAAGTIVGDVVVLFAALAVATSCASSPPGPARCKHLEFSTPNQAGAPSGALQAMLRVSLGAGVARRHRRGIVREVFAKRLDDHDDTPVDDRIVVLHGATWADYKRMHELRGERPVPRFAFLEGALEITTPSLGHESTKSRIGRLVEVWCMEHDIEFSPYGSWTLENEGEERGLEPDECYVFGAVAEPERPDLAIEVVWTTGGVKKLEIYRKLGVKEVWFWRRGRLTAHVLRGENYVEASASEVLPGIDLAKLASFIDRPTASQSMREYRASLQGDG